MLATSGSARRGRENAAGNTRQIVARPGAARQRCSSSERGLRNTIGGRLSESVGAGTLTPGDRDTLHAEAVRLYHARPVKFTGWHRRQTIEHLRYLQRAIISLIAQVEFAAVGGPAPALVEQITASVEQDLGQPPAYPGFEVYEIAEAARPKVIAAIHARVLEEASPNTPRLGTTRLRLTNEKGKEK